RPLLRRKLPSRRPRDGLLPAEREGLARDRRDRDRLTPGRPEALPEIAELPYETLMRWTTSAQSSRLNATGVAETEYWTCTTCAPAERLPLTRTIACWAESPDDFALNVFPGAVTPRSLWSKYASAPAAGESSAPSTVIFN